VPIDSRNSIAAVALQSTKANLRTIHIPLRSEIALKTSSADLFYSLNELRSAAMRPHKTYFGSPDSGRIRSSNGGLCTRAWTFASPLDGNALREEQLQQALIRYVAFIGEHLEVHEEGNR
jgi:hypothetical protein